MRNPAETAFGGAENKFGNLPRIVYIGVLETMRIDPDGIKITGILFTLVIFFWGVGFFTGWIVLRWVSAVVFFAAVFALSFFRDPERHAPGENGSVISAADGVVIDAATVPMEGFGPEGALRIAVFMNVFNVHVNRSPVSGSVVSVRHRPGKKLSAYHRNAEYENEHGDTDMRTPAGPIKIRQIAGLIARRVVTRVSVGDSLQAGDRIGIIRFGSRVDVFLPVAYEPAVNPGQKVRAGETVIARIRQEYR